METYCRQKDNDIHLHFQVESILTWKGSVSLGKPCVSEGGGADHPLGKKRGGVYVGLYLSVSIAVAAASSWAKRAGLMTSS